MIDASYKIDSRTQSLIFEAQILNGVPLWFDSTPPLAAFGLGHELRFYRVNILGDRIGFGSGTLN
jgi:hypothetical protein